MTKKDYELIAKAIVAAQDRVIMDGTAQSKNEQLRGVRRTAAHLADALSSRNPRFDMRRFLTACGYGA